MNRKRIKDIFENHLFPKTRNAIRSFLGIKVLQEEVDSLYYYLNSYIDINNLPPTNDPDLRILQKCDTMLLGIFDKMCAKYNLSYWIEYGTLLGAVRHKGFIPWDDDTDIAMPREDYNRVFDLMHEALNKYGIDIYYQYDDKLYCLCLAYQHEKTGIWCDITPMDVYKSNMNLLEIVEMLSSRIKRYKSFYDKNKKKKSSDEIWKTKEKIIFYDSNGKNKYLFHGQEFGQSAIRIFSKEKLLPTKRIQFEDIELSAPFDPIHYLKKVYGDNYMGFPRKGIEHHGGEGKGRPALKNWAKNNNVDMMEVYSHLREVYISL